MKQRDPAVSALLAFFIPFYQLYWLYVTAQAMRERGGNPPKFSLFVAPVVLLIILFFIPLFTMSAPSGSESSAFNAVMLLVGFLTVVASIVFPLIYLYRFGKTAEQLTNNKVRSMISFVCFVFFSPLAVYFIQEALNTTQNAPATGAVGSTGSVLPPSPVS